MTPHAFDLTLSHKAPPRALCAPLAALWWAKKGEWDKAHRLVEDETGAEAAWVHAYLHRVEGDLGNAQYWYRQARKPAARGDLGAEWAAMVEALLYIVKSSRRGLAAFGDVVILRRPGGRPWVATIHAQRCKSFTTPMSGAISRASQPSFMTTSIG